MDTPLRLSPVGTDWYLAGLAIGLEQVVTAINNAQKEKKSASHLQKTLHTQQAERDKSMRAMLDLYPDWKNGILTQEEYLTLKTNLQETVSTLDQSIENLKKSIEKAENRPVEENAFITHFRKFQTVSELSRPIVTELIEAIYVNEDHSIRIVPRFQVEYEYLLEYIESNKDAALPVA